MRIYLVCGLFFVKLCFCSSFFSFRKSFCGIYTAVFFVPSVKIGKTAEVVLFCYLRNAVNAEGQVFFCLSASDTLGIFYYTYPCCLLKATAKLGGADIYIFTDFACCDSSVAVPVYIINGKTGYSVLSQNGS